MNNMSGIKFSFHGCEYWSPADLTKVSFCAKDHTNEASL